MNPCTWLEHPSAPKATPEGFFVFVWPSKQWLCHLWAAPGTTWGLSCWVWGTKGLCGHCNLLLFSSQGDKRGGWPLAVSLKGTTARVKSLKPPKRRQMCDRLILKGFFSPAAANWGGKRCRAGPEPPGKMEKNISRNLRCCLTPRLDSVLVQMDWGDFTPAAEMGIKSGFYRFIGSHEDHVLQKKLVPFWGASKGGESKFTSQNFKVLSITWV